MDFLVFRWFSLFWDRVLEEVQVEEEVSLVLVGGQLLGKKARKLGWMFCISFVFDLLWNVVYNLFVQVVFGVDKGKLVSGNFWEIVLGFKQEMLVKRFYQC